MTRVRSSIAVFVLVLHGFAWTTHAAAAGVVNVDSCQELDIPNIVYKLTRDITGADGDCLIVGADRITIDL